MEYLPEERVTKDTIQQIFEHAYIDVARDSEDDIIADAKFCKVFVLVNNETKSIDFITQFKPGGIISKRKIFEIVNKLNSEYRICRFVITDTLSLRVDYSLSFARGLVPYQVVEQFRRFDRVISQALEEKYANGIVG